MRCIYGKECGQRKCAPCPIMESDDGRQSLLDEICADYRTAVSISDLGEANKILGALQKEIRHFESTEWAFEELEKAMRCLVTGHAWKTRTNRRKIAWTDLMTALCEGRS